MMKPPRLHGFTLFELVVVVSILAVLMSILVPLIGHAREASRMVRCQSHLRDQGLLVDIYAGENLGHLPPAALFASTRPLRRLPLRWFYDQVLEDTVQSIQPRDYESRYLLGDDAGGPVGIFRCPGVEDSVKGTAVVETPPDWQDTGADDEDAERAATSGYNHYEVNDYLLAVHDYRGESFRVVRPDPAYPERRDTNLTYDDLASPSSRLVVKDVKVWRSPRVKVAASIRVFHEDSLHNEVITEPADHPRLNQRPVVVHRGGMNALYADGHAELRPAVRSYWRNADYPLARTRYGNEVLGFGDALVEDTSEP